MCWRALYGLRVERHSKGSEANVQAKVMRERAAALWLFGASKGGSMHDVVVSTFVCRCSLPYTQYGAEPRREGCLVRQCAYGGGLNFVFRLISLLELPFLSRVAHIP